MPNQQHYS